MKATGLAMHCVRAALSVVLLLLVTGCSTQGTAPDPSDNDAGDATSAQGLRAPTPTPLFPHGALNPIWTVPPSIDEQIFRSDTIVRAALLSASAVTEPVSHGPGVAPTYRPLQKLRFRAHEYLKGEGPAELLVVVGTNHTHLTEEAARVIADRSVARRITT